MLQFSQDPKIAEEQMQALIFYLTTFGYIDGNFDLEEKTFLKNWIRTLVKKRFENTSERPKEEVFQKQITHYFALFEKLDNQIQELFTEVVAPGENINEFVLAKLKLLCFEIFQRFDKNNRRSLLETANEFITADGVVHPAEIQFRNELASLLDSETKLPEAKPPREKAKTIQILQPITLDHHRRNHQFFSKFEEHYSLDPEIRRGQASSDYQLLERTMKQLALLRKPGEDKLKGHHLIQEFAGQEPFLDKFVHVLPAKPDQEYELLVFGDLHGCYSCLKAGLLQFDFFSKIEAFQQDPKNNPNVKLVLLGDYIDRGKFSYNGILRAILNLFLAVPEHVYILRGNHEYYVRYKGKIHGGVRPAEAINTLLPYMPQKLFETYMRFFECLPNYLFFEKIFFVHGGIPRDVLLEQRYKDLSSLNDPDIRFQMLWSDPADADYIPHSLQRQNARFPFGRKQFALFMNQIGARVLIRGHEKIKEGFKQVYCFENLALLNLFSAGGKYNSDLPLTSSYRSVKPMALTVKYQDGQTKIIPWVIDYELYNNPKYNAFYRTSPEIE